MFVELVLQLYEFELNRNMYVLASPQLEGCMTKFRAEYMYKTLTAGLPGGGTRIPLRHYLPRVRH